MEPSGIIAFITANGVVIVVVLLSLLILLTAFIALCVTEISSINHNTREQSDTLEEMKNSQLEAINTLIGVVRSLREDVNELTDRTDYSFEIEETRKYQKEMLHEQKNIVSYFKEQILPEQVQAYFSVGEGKNANLIIENQNKFFPFENLSLSANYVESDDNYESEKLKKICDAIDSVKNISIPPEGSYSIPLKGVNTEIKEIIVNFKNTINAHITITYSVNNNKKELSVEIPLC